MQVTTLPNPVNATLTSAAAKPPATANGAFGATLSAAITKTSPARIALPSEKVNVPKSDPGPDSKAISKSDAQPEVQSGANAGTKSIPRISSRSSGSFTSQPAPKPSPKSGPDSDSDSGPQAASNQREPVADPSATAAVPPALNNIAVAIDNFPLSTQRVALPSPESPAAAVGALQNGPASQPAAPVPISPSNAHSESNTTAIGLDMRRVNLSVPGDTGADAKARISIAPQWDPLAGTNQTASELADAPSPNAPLSVGADPPAETTSAQEQFLAQLSEPAAQTVEERSAQPLRSWNFAFTGAANDTDAKAMPQTVIAPQALAPPSPSIDATQPASEAPTPPTAAVAAALAPASPQANASEVRTLRADPTVLVFSLTSSAPTPKSPFPSAKPAPVTDATNAARPLPQKFDFPVDAETIRSVKPSPASAPISATQSPSQKSGRPAIAEIIHPPLRISQDPAPSATAPSSADTPHPSQTTSISEPPSLNTTSPVAPNPDPVAQDRSTVGDAQQPAVANQKILLESVANEPKKSPAPPPDAGPFHIPSRPSVASNDPGIALVTPPSSTAPQPASSANVTEQSELPKSQQVLDSAPLAPAAPTNARLTHAAANDVQMHVGIRTTAFGAVEIHTTVVQNQVGIAVHGERSLAHWFSSEVPNLESGLKDHRLNLTAVDFGSDRSGVQTATSFQHGQPRQNFSQTIGYPAAFGDQDAAPEASTTELLPPDLTIRPAGTRVSIRV